MLFVHSGKFKTSRPQSGYVYFCQLNKFSKQILMIPFELLLNINRKKKKSIYWNVMKLKIIFNYRKYLLGSINLWSIWREERNLVE